MRQWRLDLQWLLVFMGTWLILMGQVTWLAVISGLVVSVISLWVTEKLLLGEYFYKHYPIDLWRLSGYGLLLIYEIYRAGLATIPLIISGKVNVQVVSIQTALEDDYNRSILANSITLTPGTITLDKKGDQLKVLWLNATTDDSQLAGDCIKGRLEKRLLGHKKRRG